MISSLKKLIPLTYKERVLLFKEAITNDSYRHLKNQKKAFVFLAADYKNIGDAAITYAQVSMLRHVFVNHKIIEVPLKKSHIDLWAIKKAVNDDDIITTIGGGNMGDPYYGIERIRQEVVKTFPNNRFISFPQSYSYRDTDPKSVINRAKKIYPNHEKALFLMRDENSYQKMRRQFPQLNLKLCPDIVLTFNLNAPEYTRSGLQLMLRDDGESVLTKEDRALIKKICTRIDPQLLITDTAHHMKMTDVQYRNGVFLNFIEQIKKKSLVVTDRLHGVIFCYITKTPCIAINSHNGKVKNAINTYMKCDYIKVVDAFSQVEFNTQLKAFSDPSSLNFSNNTEAYFNEVHKIISHEYC